MRKKRALSAVLIAALAAGGILVLIAGYGEQRAEEISKDSQIKQEESVSGPAADTNIEEREEGKKPREALTVDAVDSVGDELKGANYWDEKTSEMWKSGDYQYRIAALKDKTLAVFQYNEGGVLVEKYKLGTTTINGYSKVEIVGVTKKDFIVRGENSSSYVLARIPVQTDWTGKIEMKEIFKTSKEKGVDEYTYVYHKGDVYFFQTNQGKIICADGKSHTGTYISDAALQIAKTWETEDGNGYLLWQNKRRSDDRDLYLCPCKKNCRAEKILSGPEQKAVYEAGEDSFFFAGMSGRKDEYDSGNIYEYNIAEGRAEKIISWEDFCGILAEEPARDADFIREMTYREKKLYIEIRYGTTCLVLVYNEEDKSLALAEDIRELVRHKEYQFGQLNGADENYCFANNHNLFLLEEDGIVERTLTGGYVRTLHLPYHFLYVNDKEIICFEQDKNRGILYSVPLVSRDGNDYPDMPHKKKIVSMSMKRKNETISYGKMYANEKYLVFFSEYGKNLEYNRFRVYDRKKNSFVKTNASEYSVDYDSTAQWQIDNIVSMIKDDYIVLVMKCGSWDWEAAWETDEICIYHFGEHRLKRVISSTDEIGFYGFNKSREEIIYQKYENTWYSYMVEEKRSSIFYRRDDMNSIAFGSTEIKNILFDGDEIYLIMSDLGIWRMTESKEVKRENNLSRALKEELSEVDGSTYGYDYYSGELDNAFIVNGKFVCGEYYYDTNTGERWAAGGLELFDRWRYEGELFEK